MTVQYAEVSQKVRRNITASLKGKTTRRKTNIVDRDQVKIPVVLIKLHKEVFFTCDIFFVNNFKALIEV